MKRMEEFPEWKEAQARLLELQGQHNEVEKVITQLLSQASETGRIDPLTAEATALIGGTDYRPPSAWVEKMATARHRQRVLNRAIELQRSTINGLHSTLSDQICQEVKPSYAAAVKGVAQAAVRLAKEMEKEREIRTALKDNGVSFAGSLGPAVFNGPGYLDDEHSRVNHFLAEADRLGYIKKESLS